jgi:hypothetical protein
LPANQQTWPKLPSDFRISKFNTPEIYTPCSDFNSHVPTVRPLHAFPNHHGIDRSSGGQIREPQTLLQFEFLGAHK